MRNNLYICNANPQTKTTLTSPISGSNIGTHYIHILLSLKCKLDSQVIGVLLTILKKLQFLREQSERYIYLAVYDATIMIAEY